jgi:hypothetical protein
LTVKAGFSLVAYEERGIYPACDGRVDDLADLLRAQDRKACGRAVHRVEGTSTPLIPGLGKLSP